MDKEYKQKYSHLPSDTDELLGYIESNYKLDKKKIHLQMDYIQNIPWKEINFTIELEPKGSPRPRINGRLGTFYVKGAKQLKKHLASVIESEGIICGRVELHMKTYQQTPMSSMTNTEVYLAEAGYIRPISKPDFDNLAKTYTDAIEGHMLLNDNIINPGSIEKYYSIKPRIEMTLKYQCGYDSKYNARKTTSTITYNRMIEEGKNMI